MTQDQAVTTLYDRSFSQELKRFGAEHLSLFFVYLVISMGLIYGGACLKPEVGELLNKAYSEGLAPISIAILMVVNSLIIGGTRLSGPVSYANRKSCWAVMGLAPTKFMVSLMVTYYGYLLGFLAACIRLEFPVHNVLWAGAVCFPLFIFFVHWAAPRLFFDSKALPSRAGLDVVWFLLTLTFTVAVVWVCLTPKPEKNTDEKKDVNSLVMCWYGRPTH
jgi:hypothetical protein